MQVIRTLSTGEPIYVIGGAVFLAAIMILVMLTIVAKRFDKLNQ